jgi:hypothetical protein
MPYFAKVLFTFRDGDYSWTESYYTAQQITDPSTLFLSNAGKQSAISLARARAALLPQGSLLNKGGGVCPSSAPQLVRVRASLIGSLKTTYTWTPNVTADSNNAADNATPTGLGPQSQVNLNGIPLGPWNAARVKLVLQGGGSANRLLSGIDSTFNCDQTLGVGSDQRPTWKRFAKILENGAWGVESYKGIVTPGGTTFVAPPAPPWAPIAYVSQPDPNNYNRVTIGVASPGISFATLVTGCLGGAHVQIACYRASTSSFESINGTHRAFILLAPPNPLPVTPVPIATWLILYPSYKSINTFQFGYAAAAQYTVIPITEAVLLGLLAGKQRGNSIRPHRGRRKVIR